MAAIPILIYDHGFVTEQDGSLLQPPIEVLGGAQKSFYMLAKPGWSRCPFGYHVYCAYDDLGRKLVIPGIYPPDGPAPNRKFPNYPLRFSKAQIEKFASAHLKITETVKHQRDNEFKNLTHDLRAIGTEIYHGALAARDAMESANTHLLEQKINQIVNSQQMLSLRLDIIDYEGGLSSERPSDLIDPFPKIEKVLKSFEGKFFSRNIRYDVQGRCKSRIYGPPIFELVPFVIVENALKYAPYGTVLLVRYEDSEDKIVICFELSGPKISAREMKRIFDKDFRGEAAKNAGQSGSGIGLFAAKTIIKEHFRGDIFVNQLDQQAIISGREYFNTRFTIVIPSKDKDRHRR